MIIDPGDTLWEISMCLGTQYVATSRAKTFGSKDKKYPEDSSLYWTGTNVSIERIHNCKKKQNNQLCQCFTKRQKWLDHLKQKAEATRRKYTKDKLDHILTTTFAEAMAGSLIENKTDLKDRIVDMIQKPNPTWREAKKNYEQPTTFFS